MPGWGPAAGPGGCARGSYGRRGPAGERTDFVAQPLEVLLRFDTEDPFTPESDRALERILGVLAEFGLQATFPLTGSKLRALRRRGREDLIRALAAHDVGYHSDTHSVHPTLAEELRDLGWEQGVEVFGAREEPGASLVGGTFDRIACYTQPGANWVPHAFPWLRRWGVPCHYGESWNAYVHHGSRPFFFGGVLTWSAPVAAPKPFLSRLPGCLEQALAAVTDAAGTGPRSVVTHPAELCTTQFWDVVNFGAGAAPPPGAWRQAPLRPAWEIEAATAALKAYLGELIRRGWAFLTISELVRRYPDRARGTLIPVGPVAGVLRGGAVPMAGEGGTLSPAEVFAVVVGAVAAEGRPPALPYRYLDGPACEPALPACGRVSPEALENAARWCRERWCSTGRVPSAVPLPGGAAAPADFLLACAAYLRGEEPVLAPAGLPAAAQVRPAGELHWDWPVFPPGFTAPGLRAATVLQAWTWKPAGAQSGPWRPWRED